MPTLPPSWTRCRTSCSPTSVTQPSGELVTAVTQPAGELVTAVTQPSGELVTAVTQPSGELVTAVTQPAGEFVTAVTQPAGEMTGAQGLLPGGCSQGWLPGLALRGPQQGCDAIYAWCTAGWLGTVAGPKQAAPASM
jgi:hypothetical protein